MKVMIVDDSSEMRQLIRETLAPWIRDTAECADGDEAVECFSRFLPDWTLMDYRMARVDGLTAIQELRRRWPNAQILPLTGYESSAVRQEAIHRGAVRCLSKDHLCQLPACLGAVEPRPQQAPPCSPP